MKTNTNKGITLIALVITVIVLLILAGTAISIAVNGNNIFAKANTAVEGYNVKAVEQQATIETLNTQFDEYYTGYNPNQPPRPNPTAGWDMTKVASTVTGTITVDSNTGVSVTAPIPTGYVASDVEGENTIAGGLVIYQGTEPVSTDEDAITTRNQFVWIPVTNINSMIMCKRNEEGSVCDIELSNGELHCKTHDTTGATNMCGRLYGVNIIRDDDESDEVHDIDVYKTQMDFTLNTQIFSANSDYREPAIVETDNYTKIGGSDTHGLTDGAAFLAQLQNDFYAMAKSVAIYKGFYIARYEAGNDPITYTSKKGQTVMSASNIVRQDEYFRYLLMWYGLYNHLRTTMGSLNSQMIWGCQYDQAIKFIKQNKGSAELDPEIGHKNIGLGRNKDVSGAEGVSDIMKNIYDLEGNCCEWTATAHDSKYRDPRGNSYSSGGYSFSPASSRGGYCVPNGTDDDMSSRSGLYL